MNRRIDYILVVGQKELEGQSVSFSRTLEVSLIDGKSGTDLGSQVVQFLHILVSQQHESISSSVGSQLKFFFSGIESPIDTLSLYGSSSNWSVSK